jgi:hypothetical protein
MSGIYHFFLYGRTKTIDYRWLVAPKVNIEVSFFDKIMEEKSSRLRNGEILFYYKNLDSFALFCVFFLSNDFVDERGRKIAFSAGIVCSKL